MLDLAAVEAYIASVRWQNAKTFEKFAPHEYTIRKWAPELEEMFEAVVVFIREHGYTQKWHGRSFTYLDVGPYKYWTMGDPVKETVVLNREPLRAENGTPNQAD